jgi:hypothetical protein
MRGFVKSRLNSNFISFDGGHCRKSSEIPKVEHTLVRMLTNKLKIKTLEKLYKVNI